mgnify:FL=1
MATEYCFTVNGMRRTTTEKKSLLRYLRDDLHLFSVKDGCSEGACGTCTIIVDGVAVKACVLTTDKSVGRNIVTVEGLTEREQDAFVYAFGSKGSVQCGFCIPGMVMAGKALIDQNPDPTEEEIKYALRGNICRCTGYKKIIEGIQLTAAILRGDAEIDYDLERGEQYGVGQRAFRVDVRKKVLGYGKYPDDIVMDGMVHLSAVRSKYPRARVLKIDASKAEALPGVLGVLTAKDVPNNKVGHIQQDWDVMIAEGDITRMIGDTICVVVAETEEILEKAKKLTINPRCQAAIARLEEVYEVLKLYGYEKYVSFDLGMVNHFDYYTGIIFRGYTYGTGDAIGKGGRYDNLLAQFGKEASASGFTILIDDVLSALSRQNISISLKEYAYSLLLYKSEDRQNAIPLVVKLRDAGVRTELVSMTEGKTLEEYLAFGKNQGAEGILYLDGENVTVYDMASGDQETKTLQEFREEY